MYRRLFTLTLLFIGLNLSSLSNAALMDMGNFTRDTSSGLDWLDLTESNGLSYNAVKAEMYQGAAGNPGGCSPFGCFPGTPAEPNGQFYGWRYASRDEVRGLYTSAGVPLGNNVGAVGNVANLVDLLGDTIPGGFDGFFGMTSDYFLLNNNRIFLWAGTFEFFGTRAWSNANGLFVGDDLAHINRGSFLVRTSEVPVPAAAWLFVSALLGLAGIKRSR